MRKFYHDKGFIYISKKYNLIFIPIPKNGSTTIRKIKDLSFEQDTIEKYRSDISKGAYNVFTVIRDPLDRLVSGYIETILRAYNNINQLLMVSLNCTKNGRLKMYHFQ